ncbi:hypothetical protein BT69DRAFT_1337490, partial [Atractiella rhizophila]
SYPSYVYSEVPTASASTDHLLPSPSSATSGGAPSPGRLRIPGNADDYHPGSIAAAAGYESYSASATHLLSPISPSSSSPSSGPSWRNLFSSSASSHSSDKKKKRRRDKEKEEMEKEEKRSFLHRHSLDDPSAYTPTTPTSTLYSPTTPSSVYSAGSSIASARSSLVLPPSSLGTSLHSVFSSRHVTLYALLPSHPKK